jgi:MoxR-like ATPase
MPTLPEPPTQPLGTLSPLLRLQQIGRILDQEFLDKQEVVRLMLLSALAGEHLLIIGPPGTAKSALVSTLARLLSARYFEYLLTRFSEPNELLGPIDLPAFREGHYRRRSEQMLPTAEVAFLDEIFKANSAILNSLLTLLNERRVHIGGERVEVPLLALFAASNEMPGDDSLEALLDRFLVRVGSHNLESYQFHRLIEIGLRHEQRGQRHASELLPLLSADELRGLQQELRGRLHFSEEFLSTYKGLVFQIRGEGISLSDRRIVRLLKLCAASAMLDGREQADSGDLFVLRYVWNSPEQGVLLDAIVQPVLERHRRELHASGKVAGLGSADARRAAASLEELLAEVGRVRELLSNAAELSDIQLFAQLRTLGALRTTLSSFPGEGTTRMLGEIDTLIDSVFSSSRFT